MLFKNKEKALAKIPLINEISRREIIKTLHCNSIAYLNMLELSESPLTTHN